MENWRRAGLNDPFIVDWAEFLLLCLQHRIEGIAFDALETIGWDEVASPTAVSALRRRAALADARFQANYRALREMAAVAPDLVESLIFIKGAVLTPLYEAATHRMVGDFDTIVASERAPELGRLLRELGYWEKPGKNGPTYFRESAAGLTLNYVALDVHIDIPMKYSRSDQALALPWSDLSVPHMIGEVRCRRPRDELHVVTLLAHLYEHAASWIHAVLEDDLRLIRILDVELLADTKTFDPHLLRTLVEHDGLRTEVILGLCQVRAIRGAVPQIFDFAPQLMAAVEHWAETLALPDGRLEVWPASLSERAFDAGRATTALKMMTGDGRRRSHWFDWRKGLIRGSEPVARIIELAEHDIRKPSERKGS